MPELPEVETVVRALRPLLVGRTITGARNTWPRHIDRPDFPALVERLTGQTVEAIGRRGKFIIIHLTDDENLIIHLRMSGHLSVVDAALPLTEHTHTVFELDNSFELRFRDTRKFGRVYLVRDPEEVLGKLGPEPLAPEFTLETFAEILRSRKRLLKPFLLDQAMIAGIGNIYADEALFDAGIHPLRRTDTLSDEEIEVLYVAIRRVLEIGIAREGASIDTYVKPDGEMGDMQNAVMVFRRTDRPCYRCGTPIVRLIVGGRSTHICPQCQRL